MYNTIADAATALTNSGVYEWFDFDIISERVVAEHMYRNDMTPEQAAEYFNAA